ncbi:transcriptional regulatory protein ZraR [bacterium BMS3Bbin08]|nr:transcriptional regulatory protein ZraR [bacterium BMS3Bbin08]
MSANILVIDDEESICYTFESFLANAGHNVVTALDFESALKKTDESNFDLIFVDIILGGKTGLDLLQEVRKKNLRCPVVMITGAPDVETAAEALRLGAFEYIPKPIRQNTLLHVTDIALQHKALQDKAEKYRSNLEAIFRSVKEAIITVDNDLKVLEINRSAEKICGYFRDVIGRDLRTLPKHCNSWCVEALLKTISTKKSVELHRLECRRRNRPSQIVNLKTAPLLDNEGRFSGAVLVISDETRLESLEKHLKDRRELHNIIGKNKKMQNIYSLIEDLADIQTTVLITGESGTGKELVADAIHYRGNRGTKPFVKVNCSALSENLLESELFGHVKGAFTGADRDRIGRFQKAHTGTIFLDEIGDVSTGLQSRLLRVLQEKEFERVGESNPIKVDARVIAATNHGLMDKVKSGKFREDLYYRLKVVEIEMPPLRERKDDIPLLINHFLKKFNKKFNKNIVAVSRDVQQVFMEYSWPGNIRELENVLEHAFILCFHDTITVHQIPAYMNAAQEEASAQAGEKKGAGPDILLQALEKSGWNKSKAARLLGINVRTIFRKIEKYGLTEPNLK